jgi:hypothetical protein
MQTIAAVLLGEVAALDQLDAVAIGVADEGDAAAGGAAAGAVGGLLGLDAVIGEGRQGAVELVGVDAVVVGQLEDRHAVLEAHEDVDRLVADRHPADLGEAELLVEGDRGVDVADPVTGMEEGVGHGPQLILRLMASSGRARRTLARLAPVALLCAVALAVGVGSAAAAAPVTVPPPTGKTVTIAVAEVAGKLRFVGPETVAVGDELEIVDKTNPLKVGPVTFSLVRRGYLPKTRRAQANCFTPGHICWAIAEWQGVHGEGLPTINPAEAGAPGWDTMGAPTAAGDSWFSGTEPGGRFAQEVTAKAGTRLWFMDAIHPWLRGTIRVVPPGR